MSHYISDLNSTPLKEQQALPNPTFIKNQHGSFIAFTAYYMQDLSSSEVADGLAGGIKLCHYPTIFFFNIETRAIEWEIFGAEILVDVDATSNEVMYVTNEVWNKAKKREVEDYKRPDSTSKYLDYKNLINIIHWGIEPDAAEVNIESRRLLAPQYEIKKSYFINYAKF